MASVGTLPYLQIKHRLSRAQSADELYRLIVEAPFAYPVEAALLFLGFISLFLVDEAGARACLMSVSDTEYYRRSVESLSFSPRRFQLKLDNTDNSIAKAIDSNTPVVTQDWGTIGRPHADESARLNQASSGIAHSVVYPLSGETRGALMFNFYQYPEDTGSLQAQFMRRYAQLVTDVLDRSAVTPDDS